MKKNKLNNYFKIIEENKNYKLSMRTNNNSSYHRYLEMAHKQNEFYILTESEKNVLTTVGKFFLASVVTLGLGLFGTGMSALAIKKIQTNGKILNEIQQEIDSGKLKLDPKDKDEMLELIYKKYKEESGPESNKTYTLQHFKNDINKTLSSPDNFKTFKEKNENEIEEIKKLLWLKTFKTNITKKLTENPDPYSGQEDSKIPD